MLRSRSVLVLALLILTASWVLAAVQNTGTVTVVHTFTGDDGESPVAGLSADSSGNLFGTTQEGGAFASGTVFELSPEARGSWRYSLLYSFTGGNDGGQPLGTLIFDSEGNGYGTAAAGGTAGLGVVYKLSRSDNQVSESVLYNFQGGSDGELPFGNLVFDSAGNLYGTSSRGGVSHVGCLSGCGTVYELSPTSNGNWEETILHAFTDAGGEGAEPRAGVVFDTDGNLYGTTNSGGNNSVDPCNNFSSDGCGTVFELSPAGSGNWKLLTLVDFNFTDGGLPRAGVTLDGKGHLYGVTTIGGPSGGGTAFSLINVSGEWKSGGLFNFVQRSSQPSGALVIDASGNLYGTTYEGGANNWGSVFQLVPNAMGFTGYTLFSFPVSGIRTGASPLDGGLILGADSLILTTNNGGNVNDCQEIAGCGTVIELSK